MTVLQVTHQHVPDDADMVLSQDEMQLGVKLFQHLTSLMLSLPVPDLNYGKPRSTAPDLNQPASG